MQATPFSNRASRVIPRRQATQGDIAWQRTRSQDS